MNEHQTEQFEAVTAETAKLLRKIQAEHDAWVRKHKRDDAILFGMMLAGTMAVFLPMAAMCWLALWRML